MDGKEFFSLDEHGLIQAINIHTGEVRKLEGSYADPQSLINISNYTQIRAEDGSLVWVPPGINLEDLGKIQGKRRKFPYSPLLADQICTMIAEGKTLVDVSNTPGMPSYAVIAKWRKLYPEFAEMYKQARVDRAEVYFHKLLEEVENARADKDEVALARLRADMYKFAAKVCAPDEYAEKQTLDARVAVGAFTVDTGIRRPGDAGYNTDETKALEEMDAGSEDQEGL